ncbi:hypothetical protein CLOP_g25047, partial [Closterium sp. NIES-67]
LEEKKQAKQKQAAQLQKRMVRSDGSAMSLAASKRLTQLSADQATWEDRQLMRSGVVRNAAELSTDIDDEDENRVLLLVHDTKPPFLDGRIVFTKQQEPVMPLKDPRPTWPSSPGRVQRLSERYIREKQQQNKSRQKFWELTGSKLGNILGVKKSAADVDADTSKVNDEGEVDYKDNVKFADHMKGTGRGGQRLRQDQVDSGAAHVPSHLLRARRAAAGDSREPDCGGGGGDGLWQNNTDDTVPARGRVHDVRH